MLDVQLYLQAIQYIVFQKKKETPTQYLPDSVLPQGKKAHHLLHHSMRGAHLSVYNDDIKQYNNQLCVIYRYLMNEIMISDLFTFKV